MKLELTTKASPDQVLAALTDFTDRRPEVWRRTLDPRTYELRELGDTWAVARESTAGSPYWVVCRYDWTDPTVVRWTELENNFGGLGSGSIRIEPATGGGSRLHAEWGYADPARARDRVMLFLLHRGPMGRVIARMWRRTLDEYANSL